MTTAKPSDRSDPSDDLIAELAKMMAQEAQGDRPEQAPAPVNTPAPAPQSPSQPALRIPGINDAADRNGAPRPTLDFGRAPSAAPVIMPEPLSNWQNYSPRQAQSQPEPQQVRQEPVMSPQPRQEPVRQEPVYQEPAYQQPERQEPAYQEPVRQQQPAEDRFQQPASQDDRREPDFGLSQSARRAPEPAPAPAPQQTHNDDPFEAYPAVADPDASFDFNSSRFEEELHREPPTVTTDEATYDAIADLIAAGLDEEDEGGPPAPEPSSPQAQINTTAGQGTSPAPAPQVTSAPQPAAQEAAPQPAGNPIMRPVNFTTRETTPTDRFTVSPVFGLGGRANPRPIAPQAPSVDAPTVQSQPVPAPVSERQAEPQFAPVQQPEPERQQPIMPRHQPIAPAMAAIAPDIHGDPIDDIESLIGDAARVAPPSRGPSRQPIPIVASINTGLAPQRTSIPLGRTEPPAMTSEDAILAAASDTGDDMQHWDMRGEARAEAPVADKKSKEKRVKPQREAKPKREKPAADTLPRRSAMRQFIGPAVAGTLLLIAGFGLYWVLGMGHTDGTAPTLTADTAAVKEAPPVAAADANAASGSVVFNEIDGATPDQTQEQIVSRDQTSGEDVARVIAPEAEEPGLANRKVRTVTVRPDGTIVTSGGDSLAGAELLPVDRPNVPEIPGTAPDASDLLTTPPATTAPVTPNAALTGTPPSTATAPVTATPVPTTPTTAPGAPTPLPRPTFRNNNAAATVPSTPVQATTRVAAANDSIADVIGSFDEDNAAEATVTPVAAITPIATPAPQQPAARQPAARPVAAVTPAPVQAAAPAAAAPTGAAAAYVQLSSQRNEADAVAARDTIQRKFGSLFGGAAMEIKRVDLGERGIFFRVRLPAASMQSANQICSNVKSGGGDCYIPPS